MKKSFAFLTLIVFFSLLATSCKKNTEEVLGEEIEKKEVEVQRIEKQNSVTTTLNASGTVVPKEYAVISSLTPGTVEFLVPVGSQIRRGQSLYSISDTNIESNFFTSRQNFQQTEVVTQQRILQSELSLNSFEARYEFAKKNLETVTSQAKQSEVTARRSGVVVYNSAYNLLNRIIGSLSVGPAENRFYAYRSLRTSRPQILNDSIQKYNESVSAFLSLSPTAQESKLDVTLDTMHKSSSVIKEMMDIISLLFQNANPENEEVRTQVQSDQAIFSAYQTQINQTVTDIITAKNNLENVRLSNETAILQANNQLELAEIELNNGTIALKNAQESSELERTISQSQLNNASYNFANLSLASPFSGTVLSHSVSPGQQVRVGQELIEIGNLTSFEIRVEIDANLAKGLSVNDVVIIDKIIEGIVTEIEPAGNINSGKVGIMVQADNSDNAIDAGSIALVQFELVFIKDGLIIVPIKSITIDASGNYAFVIEKGIIEKREVTLGTVFGENVSVIYGLNEGDQLVLPNGVFVSEGEEVEIVNTKHEMR